tara:strand:+ start:284 stop:484 length:201 start_codon:yes stop_codon:yes gene_type:complete
MRNILSIILFSFVYSAYYSIGDTISIEDQQHPIEICHGVDGDDNGDTITLSDNRGRITILGLEIPW